VGVPVWAAPALVAWWLGASTRKEARADAMSMARLFVLLVVLGYASILIAGMHPVHVACVASAALRAAVLAPLIVVTGSLSRWLAARWGARRGGKVAAAIVGQGVPCLVWLPVILLSIETHRPQGRLELGDSLAERVTVLPVVHQAHYAPAAMARPPAPRPMLTARRGARAGRG
jgi:hypothetical protein